MKIHDHLEGDEYVELTVDSDALTVTIGGTVAERVLASYESWDQLCDAYGSLWLEQAEEYGVIDYYGGIEDAPPPTDLRAAFAAELRRASYPDDAAGPVWRAKLDAARDHIRATELDANKLAKQMPKQLQKWVDLSPQGLADSLEYVIDIKCNDGPAKVGGSKLGGLPHLPPELDWPTLDDRPTYLLVQLELAELAAADASKQVATTGILYVFITEEAHGLVHYIASPGKLAPRSSPHAVPSYMEDLTDSEARLTFEPRFFFRQTSDTCGPAAIAKVLPSTLLDGVAGILGVVGPSDAWGGHRVFGGDPIDWQAMGQSYLANELFLQICHGDGHVSVGVDPRDLRVACFDDADVGYCGT